MSLLPWLYEEYAEVDGKRFQTENTGSPPSTAVIESPYKDFDFLVDEEAEFMPIHEVETRREQHRRSALGFNDISLTHQEFARLLRIDVADTADPLDGLSILNCSSEKRSYYGDPVEEAYRASLYALGSVKNDEQWYKSRHLITNPVVEEIFRVEKRVSSSTDEGRSSSPMGFTPSASSSLGKKTQDTEMESYSITLGPRRNTTATIRTGGTTKSEERGKRVDVVALTGQSCSVDGKTIRGYGPSRSLDDPPSRFSSATTNFLFHRAPLSTPSEDIFTPDVSPISLSSNTTAWPEGIPSFKQKFLSNRKGKQQQSSK